VQECVADILHRVGYSFRLTRAARRVAMSTNGDSGPARAEIGACKIWRPQV